MLSKHLTERKQTLEMLNMAAFKAIESKRADIARMEREIADRTTELAEIETVREALDQTT